MEDFLWHKVSKQEEEKIKKEAKQIMDSFASALKKVEKKKQEAFFVEREKQLREETKTESDPEFRKRFFRNAPKKSQEYIEAEKGEWK